ncbi:recombinase family protein [Streptomyces sp. NPDC046876]|uniref:recombinase family protein n=1 Tax=Streptomyces sp. NPDC046876 TaxID=3155616 RepID=UPI0033BFCB82
MTQLAKTLSVPIPAIRKPGSVRTELPRPISAGAEPVGHVRLGYAQPSTARQSLDAQLDCLAEPGATRVFSEKISTRATWRPELEAAVKLAGGICSSGVAVTLVVHEHKRLGRGIELAMLAEELKARVHRVGGHVRHGGASTSATAPSKATTPPANAARPSAARASPTSPCCPWPSTCAARR